METPLVNTATVNEHVAISTPFAKFYVESLRAFFKGDWGQVDPEDANLNDEDARRLDEGHYGRILASYPIPDAIADLDLQGMDKGFNDTPPRLWIIRDTQAVTILYPYEY